MGSAASQEPPPTHPSAHPPPHLGTRPSTTRLSYDLPLSTRRDLRPVEYHPPVQQRSTVRNVLTLNRNTVTLVPTPDPSVFLIDFEFSADLPGHITIHYVATEIVTRDERGRVTAVSFQTAGRPPARTLFHPGARQRYRQKLDRGLDVRRYLTANLRYRQGAPIPLVVQLQPHYPDPETVDRVLVHLTYVEIVLEGAQYTPNVIFQQVLVNGTLYRMQDMYGISSSEVANVSSQMDVMRECVICLTEDSNTAVLPCNHLCLCDECARRLGTETDYHRRKCPVCRTQLRSFLRIIAGAAHPMEPSPGNTDPQSHPDELQQQQQPDAQSQHQQQQQQQQQRSTRQSDNCTTTSTEPESAFQSLSLSETSAGPTQGNTISSSSAP